MKRFSFARYFRLSLIAVFMAASGCGGGGGGAHLQSAVSTDPALSLMHPESKSRISDVDFRSELFYIQFNYTGSTPMDLSTLYVSLKMDGDSPQDITGYFAAANATTIKSASNFYQFTRALFPLPSNDVERTMTVSVSIKDRAGNSAENSKTFVVYPAPPPGDN
jgi:hypothetical protein